MDPDEQEITLGQSGYETQAYWQRRSDSLYYRYVDYIIRTVGVDAQSLIDVGTGNCPYLEWFDWITRRVSVDIGTPYRSETVEGIQGDIHRLDFPDRFDICTCLQVLEHVPDAGAFGRRLLELADLVVISVPLMWNPNPVPVPGHIHDPVSYEKLTDWMGREANYKIMVQEPFLRGRNKRLIALYDRDPDRVFAGAELRTNRIIR